MTLPTGQIAMSDMNSERGVSSTAYLDFNWVKSYTKGNPNDFGSMHGLAWYQKTNAGNCNNGNCNCSDCSNCQCSNCTNNGVNCGGYNYWTANGSIEPAGAQCINCYATNCLNCVNCDSQAYYQANCNCACTYNCNFNSWHMA